MMMMMAMPRRKRREAEAFAEKLLRSLGRCMGMVDVDSAGGQRGVEFQIGWLDGIYILTQLQHHSLPQAIYFFSFLLFLYL